MKKLIVCSLAGVVASFMTGCAGVSVPTQGGYVYGWIYSDVSAPHTVLAASGGSAKVGTASASSILGFFATGDASTQSAASSAGITKIHHVDYNAKNSLGLWAKYTVTVYGE